MKKVILFCLLFFAVASSQAVGYGNRAIIFSNDSSETKAVGSDTLYIKPGTTTNLKSQDSLLHGTIAISKQEEAVIYIIGETSIFFSEGSITNAVPVYVKTPKHRASIAVKKRKKLSAPAVPALEINQTFLIASKLVQLPEPINAIVAVSSTKLPNDAKIYRTFQAIPVDFYLTFYRKRKLKLSAYQEHQDFKSSVDEMDYALFSRPPTA
ncbi:hypothetical protein [uncultured Flavobacterium sp.]|uniref:hypothetical protein n=1 Tax=uncultured Flavobacterium sp. TaxID=165435 RepID=UPI0025F98F6A|nr:hypothetical protein [uncultured Flavobacterium sp.]